MKNRKVIFIVRSHAPTEAALARWLRCFEDLRRGFPGHSLVASMSFDVTMQSRVHRRRVRAFEKAAADRGVLVCVHKYSERDMRASFPALKQCEAKLIAEGKLHKEVKKGRSLAWGFHVEPLLLCLFWLDKRGAVNLEEDDYEVWCSEDDLGFTGDMADLVRFYSCACADVDLLGGKGRKRVDDDWWWANIATDAFFELVPSHSRLFCEEHIQRFSKRLIERLAHLATTCHVSAWSETFAPSIVDADPSMHFQSLSKHGHVGEPYAWWGNISVDEWENLSADPATSQKLYHALKW